MFNPTCCIRLAASSNTLQHRPTMLNSTMLDDVASVWPGLYTAGVTHFFPTINPRKLYFDFHPVLLYINIILFYFVHFRMGNTADAGSDNIMLRCARSASKDEL